MLWKDEGVDEREQRKKFEEKYCRGKGVIGRDEMVKLLLEEGIHIMEKGKGNTTASNGHSDEITIILRRLQVCFIGPFFDYTLYYLNSFSSIMKRGFGKILVDMYGG